jgi:hypothetical protein
MDDDEKRAWLLEHCVLNRLDNDIDRMFARLNHFVVASAFLVAAYVALAIQGCGSGLLTGVSWTVVVTGLLLSFLF